MVSQDNVIQVNSICICGNGDTENNAKNYFENKCPACGKEGTLQAETKSNVEVKDEYSTDNDESSVTEKQEVKVVCKNCGSEFCGQDGYDLSGGTRASLNSVNPNEITDGDEELSEEEEEDSTYMSGWEGLCDLLKPLDAEAMIVQRGDYVIVKKIDMLNSIKLWAYEGINIIDDSVTITDYTPEIYNTFVIRWGESFENELEFVFEKHKKLFGERKKVMEATKFQTTGEESEDSDEESDSGGGGIFDMLFGGSDKDKDKNNSDKNTTSSLNTGNVPVTSDGEGDEEEENNTEEVPITTKEEAMQFGKKQIGKAKRDDGHTVELKVIGNQLWQVGEWCHVKIPTFNEDSYMFISKCSFESSPDSEYITSLTLVDYPPSLGKPSKKTQEDSGEETGEETGDSSDGAESGSSSDGSSSSSSSSG